MKPAEILEWVMGWPWPVLIVFVVVMAGGVSRIISWDKQNPSEDQSSSPIPRKQCICPCE
jgi:hypothetical protein